MCQSYLGGGSNMAVTVYIQGMSGIETIHIPQGTSLRQTSHTQSLIFVHAANSDVTAVIPAENVLAVVLEK